MAVKLSILVVNYNTQALLAQCLESLEKNLSGKITFEAVVVDNASKDNSVDWAKSQSARWPWLKVVASPRNLGFAGGNNLGFPQCVGAYLLLLNSDALLIDDSVQLGISFLENNAAYFAVAAHLLNGDYSSGPSFGSFPSPKILWKELTQVGFGRLRAISPAPGSLAQDVDFPCGAFFLIRRELLDVIGVMDDGYFLYFEETDWAKRARDLGYRIRYLPQCQAIHLGGASSSGRRPVVMSALFYESWRRYIRAHHGLFSLLIWGALLKLYLLAGLTGSLLRWRVSQADYFARQYLALMWGFMGSPSLRFKKG